MAFTYLQNNKNFSYDELENTNEYIRSKTKLFSGYVDYQSSRLLIATSLVDKFDKLLEQDDKLNEVVFKSNNYLPLANYALLISSKDKNIDECIENAYCGYKNMREYHPFLTGYDDYPVCTLISTCIKDIKSKIEKIEEYYKMLNEVGFYKGNSLQLLSHILLSFSDEDIYTKTTQCKMILNKLKENKMNLSTDYYSKTDELLSITLSACIEYIIQAQYIATMVVVTSVISSSNN